MDLNQLKNLSEHIIKNGIKIADRKYLEELYLEDGLEVMFNKLEELVKDCNLYYKQLYTFSFFIGFFNLNSEIDITNLPDIKDLNSYVYLKGALMRYFKDELKIKHNYHSIQPYFNTYSFVANWWPRPFSIHFSLINLLNWIYLYDQTFFFKLFFKEKYNYLFLSLFKGRIVKNFKIKEENIDYRCETLKLYALFEYLLFPYDYSNNISLNEEELEIWNYNLSLIKKIDNDNLIQIILDFIRYEKTKKIPSELIDILENNSELCYIKLENMHIPNIRELKRLYALENLSFKSENKFFEILLMKLKYMLTKKFITINNLDWRNFLIELETNEIKEIKDLIFKIKNDLKYICELDKEIRFEMYDLDMKKLSALNELIKICDENL